MVEVYFCRMPRQFALVFALVLVLAAVSAPSSDSAGEPSPPKPEAPAGKPPPVRAGRAFTVEEAIKELSLVRPSRQKRAEDFTVPTPEAGSFRLGEHRGKVILVNFWATWCPPCLEEMPALDRLYRRHKDAGFVMVAVSLDVNTRKVAPFVSGRHFAFAVGLDPKSKVAELYGVRALPSTFIIDRDGNLSALALGPRVWDNDASHALVEGMVR